MFAYNADSLRSVLDTISDPYKKSIVLERLSEHFRFEGDFDSSYYYLGLMKEVCEKHNLKSQLAEYYNFKGINQYVQGKLDASVECMQKSLELYIELNDSASIANMYENLGMPYTESGQYQKAIESQLKSLEIREENGWMERIPSLYCNIAVIYERLGDGKKMEEYMYKAKHHAEKHNLSDKHQLITIYNELGNVKDNNAESDSCLYYYNKGLELAKEIGWKRGVSTIMGNIADLYYDWGQYDKSLQMHFESLKLEKEVENTYGIAKEYQFIARIFKEKKDFESAKKYGELAYETASGAKMLNEIANACEILSDIYDATREYEKAFIFQKEFKLLSDSIVNIDHKNFIVDLEEKYQSTVKQQKIDLLTQENELHLRTVRVNRIIILAISIISILIALVFIFLLRFRRKQSELQKTDMEQKLLRNQMNPHFIFNALGAIQNFMYKNQPKEAGKYLGEFSTLTRSILKHTREDFITLEEEIISLKSYLELEKLRMKGAFEYDLSFDEDLETEFIQIPPMLIQPFVENAIKHGIKDLENGEIQISIQDKGDFIHFTVADNGVGLKSNNYKPKENHISYATKIFEERRKILKRQFNKSIHFAITDLTEENLQGTRVEIQIPVIEEK